MNEDNHPQKQVRPHLSDDRASSESELSSLSLSRDPTGSLREIGAIEDPFSRNAVILTSANRPTVEPKGGLTSSYPHDTQFCINMCPVRDLGPAVDDSDASLLPLIKYTEGNNFDLLGISDFLSSDPELDPKLQCAALQLLEHAAEWQNSNFIDNMSVTFGPVAKLLLDSQDNLVHYAALDTLKPFLASPCAIDIIKSMIPRRIVDVVSNDLNSSDPIVQLASVELLNSATRSEEILVEFAAAVSLISIALPSMPAATQVIALRVLEVSAGSRAHKLIKAVAETFHYLYHPLSSPEPTVQIAVLEVLEAAAKTKDPKLANIFKAILPAVKEIQSFGETGLHSAAKKVLETAAHNDQLADAVEAISPNLLRQSSDKPGVQIPAAYGKSQALRPVGHESDKSVDPISEINEWLSMNSSHFKANEGLFLPNTPGARRAQPPSVDYKSVLARSYFPTETSVQIDFKEKQTTIPLAAVKKLEQFAHGAGGLSDIWKCSISTRLGTRTVAVKSIRVPQSDDKDLLQKTGRMIRREVHVWIKLEHKHILPLEGIIDGFGLLPALVSPWMENGSLNYYLKWTFTQLSDRRKLELIQQVVAGLSYLHGNQIVHGNLTGTNIFVDGYGSLRLADFGLSLLLVEAENATFSSLHPGNTRWMAPEFVTPNVQDREGELPQQKLTKAGDIYSFGCVMLQILSGKEPYGWIKAAQQVIGAIMLGWEPFRGAINMTVTNRQLSSQCLSKEPGGRPSILEIMTILGGDWPMENT